MGAGSTVFVRNVLGDCMCSEVLRDWEFALYDIDGVRLSESAEILGDMNETLGAGLVQMIDSAAMENSVTPWIGSNFDVTV